MRLGCKPKLIPNHWRRQTLECRVVLINLGRFFGAVRAMEASLDECSDGLHLKNRVVLQHFHLALSCFAHRGQLPAIECLWGSCPLLHIVVTRRSCRRLHVVVTRSCFRRWHIFATTCSFLPFAAIFVTRRSCLPLPFADTLWQVDLLCWVIAHLDHCCQ